jgi:hypothetical protein
MAIASGSGLRRAWLGAAVAVVLFVVFRISGVFTDERVFADPGTVGAVQLLYAAVLAAFSVCLLLLGHRIGQRWAATRGLPGYWAAMGLGIHLMGWCCVGIVVGAASATGAQNQAAWIAALLVLFGSAVVILTALGGLLRLRSA